MRGRPSAYRPEFAEQARKLALLGATNDELASFFCVGGGTIDRWIAAHEEFRGALKAGRQEADATVGERLYQRATGYSHDAVGLFVDRNGIEHVIPYTKHYPPDTTAAIFWLKNRRPTNWRDKQEVEHSVSEDFAERLIRARARSRKKPG